MYFKNGYCTYYNIKVDPEAPACKNFKPKHEYVVELESTGTQGIQPVQYNYDYRVYYGCRRRRRMRHRHRYGWYRW